MVFVQSFWSKPFLNLDSSVVNYRSAGGFIDKRYFYYCWALSFLHLKELGERIILFTDDTGMYLLVDVLGLDYSDIFVEFNQLDHLPSAYWAIPKLVAYSRVNTPFLHVDGDLLVYNGFKNLELGNKGRVFEFENRALSKEHIGTIELLDRIALPESPDGGFAELNCGVVGGTDYRFFNDFAEYSLSLFYNNLSKLDTGNLKYNKNVINSYFEQYLAFCYARHRGKDFHCIYEGDPRETYRRDFFLSRNKEGRIMTHFLMNLKSKFSPDIELMLRIYYPDWYQRINDLMGKNIL